MIIYHDIFRYISWYIDLRYIAIYQNGIYPRYLAIYHIISVIYRYIAISREISMIYRAHFRRYISFFFRVLPSKIDLIYQIYFDISRYIAISRDISPNISVYRDISCQFYHFCTYLLQNLVKSVKIGDQNVYMDSGFKKGLDFQKLR